MRQNKTTFEECNEMLEDVLTQIQDFREEFTSTLDDIEDMITSAMNADVSGLCPKNPQGTSPLTHLPGSAQTRPCRKRGKGCSESLMSRDFRGITGRSDTAAHSIPNFER